MAISRRKFWGWGNEGDGPNEEQSRGIARTLAERFAVAVELAPEPRLEDTAMPAPRVTPPRALAASCSSDPHARASIEPRRWWLTHRR